MLPVSYTHLVDQNGNKVDTYVNAKLYYTTASRVREEFVPAKEKRKKKAKEEVLFPTPVTFGKMCIRDRFDTLQPLFFQFGYIIFIIQTFQDLFVACLCLSIHFLSLIHI